MNYVSQDTITILIDALTVAVLHTSADRDLELDNAVHNYDEHTIQVTSEVRQSTSEYDTLRALHRDIGARIVHELMTM